MISNKAYYNNTVLQQQQITCFGKRQEKTFVMNTYQNLTIFKAFPLQMISKIVPILSSSISGLCHYSSFHRICWNNLCAVLMLCRILWSSYLKNCEDHCYFSINTFHSKMSINLKLIIRSNLMRLMTTPPFY